MGNLCGKQESENFAQPGRVLGSAPVPSKTTSSVPKGAAGGGGGSSRNTSGTGSVGPAKQTNADADNARAQRANAAERRGQTAAKVHKGPLHAKVASQKKQTRNDILKEVSEAELRARDADEAARARRHE